MTNDELNKPAEGTSPETETPVPQYTLDSEPQAEATPMIVPETQPDTAPVVEPAAIEPAPIAPMAIEPVAIEPAAIESVPVEQASAFEAAQTPPAETPAPGIETAVAPAAGEAAAETAHPAPAPKRKEKKVKMSEEQFAPLWEELSKAQEAGTVLTVRCTKAIRGGALVEYKGLEGFIPMSHFDLTKNPTAREVEQVIGQEVEITIIELSDKEEQRFVCSRRTALKKQHFTALTAGMVLEGRVTSITDYGVFVDLGGVDGLIHISRLSKVRVNHPSDVVKKNQVVKVTVVDVDFKNERIALSMKEFTESPWMHAAEKYTVGTTHTGKVRNITSFAAYVQLEPGIDGMIHISDLSWTRRVIDPKEILKVGEEIPVKVLEVKPDKERIGLSYRETQPDPWPRLANIYPVGTEADAKIKQLNKAGAIVELHEVDGFVPQGKMGMMRKKGAKREPVPYNMGDQVRVRVVDIDIDNRSLICAVVREEQSSSPREERRRDEVKSQPSERGFTLGDLPALQNFMKDQQAEAAEARRVERAAAEAAAAEAAAIEAAAAEAAPAEAAAVETAAAPSAVPVAEAIASSIEPAPETAPAMEAPAAEAPAEEAPATPVVDAAIEQASLPAEEIPPASANPAAAAQTETPTSEGVGETPAA